MCELHLPEKFQVIKIGQEFITHIKFINTIYQCMKTWLLLINGGNQSAIFRQIIIRDLRQLEFDVRTRQTRIRYN